MNKTKHVHKLQRHRYKSGTETYFCVLDCTFKVTPALALGKKSLCHRCGEEFSMNEYSIRLAKPHCPNCTKPKEQKDSITDLKFDERAIDTAIIEIEDGHNTVSVSLRDRLNQVTQDKEEDL